MVPEKKYRVLLVDDEPDITSVVKIGLEKEGFEVQAFNDPSQALSHFKADSFDLVLLDIRMQPMNGFQLYKQLRKIDDKVKVCFITAFEIYYDEFKKVFPNLRVNCFVRKPVRLQELAKTIMAELERVDETELLDVQKTK
jgi:DNA-binding response OmpR family regulator